MECEYEGIHKLSNGTIFNDDIIQRQITRKWYNIELFLQRSIERCHFQRPWTTRTPISRLCQYLTLNISETAKDMAIVAMIYLTYCHGDADARIGRFTRLLHAERCWVISVAWWMSRSRCLQWFFAISIHLFLGFPCLLVPCTYPWSASFGYLVWSILCTWPKYCIRRCCMRFATSCSRPNLSNTSLFWSCLCYRRRIKNHIQVGFLTVLFSMTLTRISRSWYYLTSNNSKTVQDRAMVDE